MICPQISFLNVRRIVLILNISICILFTVLQIDRLLAIADFGPLEENSKLDQSDLSRSEASDTSASSIKSNLFGIDHEVLNKQIMEYKKTKVKEVEGIGLLEQQQEQLAEIRKQMKMRKKKTKEYFDNDITPQRYLLDKYDYLDADVSSQENELEYELQEMTSEVEVAVEEDGK
uniref:Uncharacterized protein n=1 Tax=Sphenodon punctatus TaxID=8508 RepID=A0A8D0GR69_SPHPU